MGAQYAETHTDNQITDPELSLEDKQAQLSASLAEMNHWKKLWMLCEVSDIS